MPYRLLVLSSMWASRAASYPTVGWLSLYTRVHGSPMGGTTGVSLEQGLGLTDVPRGCPGRRPGDERSYAPNYYFMGGWVPG